jgi:hypothetical protein
MPLVQACKLHLQYLLTGVYLTIRLNIQEIFTTSQLEHFCLPLPYLCNTRSSQHTKLYNYLMFYTGAKIGLSRYQHNKDVRGRMSGFRGQEVIDVRWKVHSIQHNKLYKLSNIITDMESRWMWTVGRRGFIKNPTHLNPEKRLQDDLVADWIIILKWILNTQSPGPRTWAGFSRPWQWWHFVNNLLPFRVSQKSQNFLSVWRLLVIWRKYAPLN